MAANNTDIVRQNIYKAGIDSIYNTDNFTNAVHTYILTRRPHAALNTANTATW